MEPERRLKGRNGRGDLRRPTEPDSQIHNLLRAKNGLDNRGHLPTSVNGLREHLEVERKRVPGKVLFEADQLECQFFAGDLPLPRGI